MLLQQSQAGERASSQVHVARGHCQAQPLAHTCLPTCEHSTPSANAPLSCRVSRLGAGGHVCVILVDKNLRPATVRAGWGQGARGTTSSHVLGHEQRWAGHVRPLSSGRGRPMVGSRAAWLATPHRVPLLPASSSELFPGAGPPLWAGCEASQGLGPEPGEWGGCWREHRGVSSLWDGAHATLLPAGP